MSSSSSFSLPTASALFTNFGAVVRVILIDDERGVLVEIADVVDSRGLSQGGVGQRYYAKAEFLTPA